MADSAAPAERERGAERWLAAGALLVLALLVVSPAFGGGFLWDDDDYVTENENHRSLAGLGRIWFEPTANAQYYPLVYTSFWIETRLWGLNPTGYHVVNALLHGLACVLLWRLLERLGLGSARALSRAWLVAALFAVHPVCVESVAWITERKNVLSAVFYFGAALWLLRFDPPQREGGAPGEGAARSWRAWGVALALFTGALLSKTVTSTLPAAFLVVLWWKRGRLARRDVVAMLPFFALGVALGLQTAWLERNHAGAETVLQPLERVLLAGRAPWFYASKAVAPLDLSFVYERWELDPASAQWLFPLATLALLGGAWALRERAGRGLLATLLLFGGALFPCLGFFDVYPFRYYWVADHFQYLALPPLLALLVSAAAAGVARIPRAERYAPLLAALWIGVLAFFAWAHAHVFREREVLWRSVLDLNPSAWIAHHNLGVVVSERGALEEGAGHLLEAIRLRPHDEVQHGNLDLALTRLVEFGTREEARRALELRRAFAELLERSGQGAAAARERRRARAIAARLAR